MSETSSSEESDISEKEIKSTPITAKNAMDVSDDSDSSEESSSEESDTNHKGKVPAKLTKTARVTDTANISDDLNSSEESSSEESDTNHKGKAPAKPTKKARFTDTANISDDSNSSEESSSEESDTNYNGKVPAKPTEIAPVTAQKIKGDSDDSDGSEESSSEESGRAGDSSDSSSSEEEEKVPPVQTAPAQSNKKRKADNETAALPKKAKLADDNCKSIFVGRLSWNVDNDWLAQEFADCGEVESAHVQMDRNTGRSRGFGYVHFKTTDAVEKALALNGKEIDGRPVNIDKSGQQPDKKASIEKRAQAFGDTTSPPTAVLFVGNLSFGVTEDAVWETFGEHGDVKSVRIPTDRETGRPKGFAYVEFSEVGSAKKAHGTLQGYELDGRPIRLDFSQPRDSTGSRGGGQGGRGGRGSRGRGGGFGGDRGRGAGRGGRGGGDRGGRGRGRGARTGGITHFEGQKITFD